MDKTMPQQIPVDIENYKSFLIDVKSKIETARIQATRTVNRNLVTL